MRPVTLAIILVLLLIFGFGYYKWVDQDYFSDDFEGDKGDWVFTGEEGKPASETRMMEDENGVLQHAGYKIAKLEKEWEDYTLKFRFKRVKGAIHINFRESSKDEFKRYYVSMGDDQGTAISLRKQVSDNFQLIKRVNFKHNKQNWHTLDIRGRDNILNVYVDDKFLIKYKDTENPIFSGKVAFEILRDSEFLIDDVEIKSAEDVAEEIACPYECCADNFYNPKACPAGNKCYNDVCYPKDQEIELLKDTKFEWGFTDAGGGSNLPDDKRCAMPIQGEPVWRITEVSTEAHFCNNLPNPKSTDPEIIFESKGGYKKFYSYKDGRVKLVFDTSVEEKEGCQITNPMTPLSGWTHYGTAQDVIVDFADFEEVNFNLNVKLNKFEPNIPEQKCTEYGAPVEKYGEFVIVFLLKRKEEGYAPQNLFWVLLAGCSKHWWPGAYERGEEEHKECKSNSAEYILKDQLGIPIYHPAMDTGSSRPAIPTGRATAVFANPTGKKYPMFKEGEWVNYNVDLKKLAEDAINYYNSQNDPDLKLDDYRLDHISTHWEIMGAFDTEIELKNFSLRGKYA